MTVMHRLHPLRRAGTACLLGLTFAIGLLAATSEWALASDVSTATTATTVTAAATQSTDLPMVEATATTTPDTSATSSATSTNAPESRAVTVATGIAQLTGLAISPLLVLVVIGWRDFVELGGSTATSLPIHANPWFLIPCTITLAAAVLQRCTSPGMPLPIRKAIDAGAYLEAKLAALVAAGVLLPTIASTMAAAAGSAVAPDPNVQAAGFLSGGLVAALVFVAAFAMYISVWITFHVIDALIVLSPFAIVDAALVALRASILGVLGVALLVHPFLALLLALPLIVLSFLFAGWCIRLDLFALSVAIDVIFGRRDESGRPRAFLARSDLGAPIRTMGHAEPVPGGIRFSYRPFFVLPKRTLEVPVDSPEVVQGVVWPTLADARIARGVVSFPPRYRRDSERLAARFGARVREGRIRSGLRRIREAFAALASSLSGESAAQT